MRLIDGTIQALPLLNYILERKETFIKVLKKSDNDFLFAMLMDYFDSQPTTYDVEAVVAELEKEKAQADYYFHYDDDDKYFLGKLNGFRKAIEIVRNGGKE